MTQPAHQRKSFWLRVGSALVRLAYRITSRGLDRLPAGPCLLLPNHVTWVDAVILQTVCPRPIRFIMDEAIYRQPLLHPLFQAMGVIPITRTKVKGALAAAVERLKAGELVCLFPEGELSRTGTLLRLKRGFELIAQESGAPVVPVWLDRLWGSIFSFYGGRYFKKIPRQLPYPVMVAFGAPVAAAAATVDFIRQCLLDLGERCYGERPILRGHLALASVRGLKHRQFATALIDGLDHSTLSRGMLLAAAIALARHLRRQCPNPRVAAVLPTGKAAVITNLAIALAGKVPVNLNFTAGRAALEAAGRIAGFTHAVTAKAFAGKFPEFPFPAHVLYLDDLMPRLKPRIALWRALVFLLPWRLLAALLGLPEVGDRKEAVVLFTSGSSGEPKGVVLSHRNILGNVTQFSTMLDLKKDDAILACLPFFHSFGCTVTLWYPLIDGVPLVTYVNPLDAVANAKLIERYRVTMLLSTPTFLRAYLRRVDPEHIRSVRLVITGAEKLPAELAAAFKERFGKEALQGYGLTETAPVVSTNLPDPLPSRPRDTVQPSNRPGSVGKLAAGIAARIRDPDTGADLSLHQTGMLWLRGPNIFEGYLNDPERTAAVLVDGWFKTGDLGRFDEDGFLYIEGRLSRFSKIGGEMVPHERLEAEIVKALALPTDGDRIIAAVGVPDEAKGEALVLLATRPLDPDELRARLSAAGLPNLWVPKRIKIVPAIPTLASGKLDLHACKQAALAP